LEKQNAEFHRAAAARARKLRADATTRWSKEYLAAEIARHEEILAEIEKVSEPDAEPASAQYETAALSSETPG
jgi:hypothetical protein